MIDLKNDVMISSEPVPWMSYKIEKDMVDHLWKIVKEGRKKNNCVKNTLVGQISGSFALIDENNHYTNEVLIPLAHHYIREFRLPYPTLPFFMDKNYNMMEVKQHTFMLKSIWGNYQYKHEFNPLHNHTGFLSFVVWLKIPYDEKSQSEIPFLKGTNDNSKFAGKFTFVHNDLMGMVRDSSFPIRDDDEGRMLMFPSELMHMVYPFYGTDEARVSISGNLMHGYKFDCIKT